MQTTPTGRQRLGIRTLTLTGHHLFYYFRLVRRITHRVLAYIRVMLFDSSTRLTARYTSETVSLRFFRQVAHLLATTGVANH
jgi:hypothetical protein